MEKFETEFVAGESEQQAAEPEQETTQEPEPEAIPDELAGLDDDKLAREIMEEAKQAAVPAPQASEEQTEPEATQEDQDAPGPIPYKRFKQVLDKGKDKDAEIARLKAELESIRNQPQQPPAAPVQQPQQPVQRQEPPRQENVFVENGFELTPENVNIINQEIQKEALQLSGLTAEDLDSMEYMEDNDPKKQRWQYAQEFAKSNVMAKIRQAQQMELQRRQALLAAHNASVADFNRYATAAQQEPDFEEVKNFAVNEYFTALPSEQDKQAIAGAYARIERQTASPAEIALIKNYFAQAQAAYRRQHPVTTTNKKSQANKFEQANSFPKSQQVNGSSDAGGGISVASLEKMLRETPFDQIDPKYQKLLLGE